MTNICIKCKFHAAVSFVRLSGIEYVMHCCEHEDAIASTLNVVTGETKPIHCWQARQDDGLCGPGAIWWKEKTNEPD